MNFKSYGRRMVVFVIAAGITLVAAGASWAATADNVDDGAQRDRVAAAAVKAAGGGEATDVEHSDDVAGGFEVEVRKSDGTEVDVHLDKSLKVLHRENDDADDNDDNGFDNDDDGFDNDDDGIGRSEAPADNDDNPRAQGSTGPRADDDRPLTKDEQSKVEAAAKKAVGSGTVVDMETSDDLGTAFEAEVRDSKGVEWDVELDSKFGVVSKTRDN